MARWDTQHGPGVARARGGTARRGTTRLCAVPGRPYAAASAQAEHAGLLVVPCRYKLVVPPWGTTRRRAATACDSATRRREGTWRRWRLATAGEEEVGGHRREEEQMAAQGSVVRRGLDTKGPSGGGGGGRVPKKRRWEGTGQRRSRWRRRGVRYGGASLAEPWKTEVGRRQ